MFTINNFNIIATFPGTKPSSDMSFSAYKNGADNPSSKKAYQCVLSGETDKVSFKASNFGPEAVRNVQCKYVHLSIILREREISNSILLDILSVFILKRTTH